MRQFTPALSFLLLAVHVFAMGCATKPTPIPAAYFEGDREIAVNVVKLAEAPMMRDSGGGGLIGVLVNAGRAAKMRKMFDGIEGDTVKELLNQQLSDRLESLFIIEEDSEDLVLEVTAHNWGWFVPSTMLGIKTGSYQVEINGEASVYDMKFPGKTKRQRIGFTRTFSQAPIGNDPTSTETMQALLEAVGAFSDAMLNFLLSQSGATSASAAP